MNSAKYVGPSKLTDSDTLLLNTILTILDYSDCCYDIIIDKQNEKIIAHIIPSNVVFKQEIIDNLLWCNKFLRIKIVFSKSLAISKTISFTIYLTQEKKEN